MIHGITGDKCLEGTRQVPKKFKACCESFDFRTSACQYEARISWYSKNKMWGLPVLDGGASFIHIKYCPFCGKEL